MPGFALNVFTFLNGYHLSWHFNIRSPNVISLPVFHFDTFQNTNATNAASVFDGIVKRWIICVHWHITIVFSVKSIDKIGCRCMSYDSYEH
jgi:hypothetical protein